MQVYQIAINGKLDSLMFRGLEDWREIKPNIVHYRKVFDGDIGTEHLEEIYFAFNCGNYPENYKGHSLSVSDVVRTSEGYFFCDSVGFKKLESFNYVNVPRFCGVRIRNTYPTKTDLFFAGYKEPTFYNGPVYIYGRSAGINRMEFAAAEKKEDDR